MFGQTPPLTRTRSCAKQSASDTGGELSFKFAPLVWKWAKSFRQAPWLQPGHLPEDPAWGLSLDLRYAVIGSRCSLSPWSLPPWQILDPPLVTVFRVLKCVVKNWRTYLTSVQWCTFFSQHLPYILLFFCSNLCLCGELDRLRYSCWWIECVQFQCTCTCFVEGISISCSWTYLCTCSVWL